MNGFRPHPYQALWDRMVHDHRDQAPFTEKFRTEFFALLERLAKEKAFPPNEVASTYANAADELQSLNRAATAIEGQIRSLSHDAKSFIQGISLESLPDDTKYYMGKFTSGIDNSIWALAFLVGRIAVPMLRELTARGEAAIRTSRIVEPRTQRKMRVAAVLFHISRLYQLHTGQPIRRVSQDTSPTQIAPWLFDIVREVGPEDVKASAIDLGLRALRRYRPVDLSGTPTPLGYEEAFTLLQADEIADHERTLWLLKQERRAARRIRRAEFRLKTHLARTELPICRRHGWVKPDRWTWPWPPMPTD